MSSNVTHLAAVRHRDTIGALRHLLARAERGEIGGVNFVAEDLITGEDLVGYTGSYRRDPGRLASFLSRLVVRLCGIADAQDDLPSIMGGP